MSARRYKNALRVFNSIPHLWAQQTSEIRRKRREGKFHISKQSCITLPNFINTNDDVSDDFPKSSDHFPNILRMLSEGHTNVSEYFTKICKDLRRFPKLFEPEEDPKMFVNTNKCNMCIVQQTRYQIKLKSTISPR